MDITVSEDAGNSPQKELVLEFNRAFAENNTEKVLTFMTDDITWNLVGNKVMHGKDEVREMLKTMVGKVANALAISSVVISGDRVVANGEMRFPSERLAFCDLYLFTPEMKIKELTSYGIELK